MSEFNFPDDERVITVSAEEYGGDLSGKLHALTTSYKALPDYFGKPKNSEWDDEGNLTSYGVEIPPLMGRLDQVDNENGFFLEKAYMELNEIVHELHSNDRLEPHGQLIQNTYWDLSQPVILNPKGVPETEEQRDQWIENDILAMQYFEEVLTPEGENYLS